MSRKVLQGNRVMLVRTALYGEIRDHLIQDDLLDWFETETVDAEKTRHEKIAKLLDIIRAKPEEYSDRFLETLSRADPILYAQIDQSPADAPSTCNGGGGDDSTGALKMIQTELQTWYRDALSRLHPIPWCEWLELDLDHVFTNLEVAPARKHLINPRHRNGSGLGDDNIIHKKTKEIQEPDSVANGEYSSDTVTLLSDVFAEYERRTVCFVEGPAGIGKSTLSRRLLHLWAKDNGRIHSRHFDMVLCLTASTLLPDVKSSIAQQLFPEDFPLSKDEIYQCLVDHQTGSLLIIDGLDELTPEGKCWVMKLLGGGMLRHVNLLLTGRPEVSREFVKHANVHLLLQGFTADNVRSYVGKYFGEDQPKYKDKLLDRLKKDFQLQELANNPFTTLLLCLLVQDSNGEIPSTSSEIYCQVISASCRNYVERQGSSAQCSERQLFQAAAHLAYTWLTLGVSVFPERDMASVCCPGFERHLLDSGILNRDFTLSRLHAKGYCYFPHRSFQEYLCAWHLSGLSLADLEQKLIPLDMAYGAGVNMYRYLLSILTGRESEIKVVLGSMCDKVGKVQDQNDIVIVERLRWVIQIAYSNELGATMIDFLADRISKGDILLRAICRGAFYGYWAGELLVCVHKALTNMTLKPVVIVDAKISPSVSNGHSRDACVVELADSELGVVHRLFLGISGELLVNSKGPRSLAASPSEPRPWSCVHCGSPKSATALLQKGVRTSILSVVLFPYREAFRDMCEMVDSLSSLRINVTVLVLFVEDVLCDQLHRYLSTLKAKNFCSAGSRYYFLKLPPTYSTEKDFHMHTHTFDNRNVRIDCVLKRSIHDLYLAKFSPY